MPSTIPYDASLVMGSIVEQKALDSVQAIAKQQALPDAAQAELNALLSLKRSLDMTKTELLQLGIKDDDTNNGMKKLNAELKQLDTTIPDVAAKYCDAKINTELEIKELRSQMKGVNAEYESPVDYVKTQIKTMPLAADSMNMDVQYFARDENNQSAEDFATTISNFVSGTTSQLGSTVSGQATSSAKDQAAAQAARHSIAGTLVLSVTCTHKNASLMAPLVLNVDKAVKAWNHFYGKTDKLVPTDGKAMVELANQPDPDTEGNTSKINKLSIISGMTFGSSFVGMVRTSNPWFRFLLLPLF